MFRGHTGGLQDFFHDKFNARPENGGQRVATVLM